MGKRFYVLIFLYLGLYTYSQSDNILPKNLESKIEDNRELLKQDPDKAFLQTNELLKEAIQQKDTKAELEILKQRGFYHYVKLDIEKAIEAYQLLKSKAVSYNNFFYQSTAHIQIAQAYIDSELFEKAMVELDSANQLLSKVTENNDKVYLERANLLIISSNLPVEYMNQPAQSIKKIQKAIHEVKKIEDKKLRNKVLHLYYANLGNTYKVLDMDSAEFFVNKSLELKNVEDKEGIAMYSNYITLGKVHKSRKEYSTAVSYFLKAESLNDVIGSLRHLEDIYTDLIEIYESLGDQENLNKYTNKLDRTRIQISDNRNKSLYKVIKEAPGQRKSIFWPAAIFSTLIILGLSVLLLYFFRKNKRLAQQEKKSREYLQEKINSLNEKLYQELIELAKNKDDTFLAAFHKALPDFSQKILSINPTMAQTEIEFCALLKLDLSTKEIAQIQNIESRTVQNKKYRIRKRLNIPNDMDTYYYFNRFL